MTNVYLTGTVTEKRLQWALNKCKELGPKLGPGTVLIVLNELGLETYADFHADDTFTLHDLSDLQWIALASALAAFREANDEQGLELDGA